MSATAVAVRKPFTMPRMSGVKMVFSWIGLALIAFPLAGYAGWGIGGHVDGVGPALIGGAITGAGIGLVQWLFLRRDLNVGPAGSWHRVLPSQQVWVSVRPSLVTRRLRVSSPQAELTNARIDKPRVQ